ncbi:6647_t:CDS:2 [Cetraspora pellucida]|uniref:6647_t:CDS:1 n=1 Tax=Cetraspora pellucida TaxID=1433469 RepID=A0A9N9FDY1_9GLOM|nr:6647_t:CDS:2 [Cetraspora pellucida]
MKTLLFIGFLFLLQIYSAFSDLFTTVMVLAPKNHGIWSACTEYSITYLDHSLVYSLSGAPTVPQVGGYELGNVTSVADLHGFEYVLFPYSSNGTVDYCGSSTTICRFVGYHNYNLPRDRYCIAVLNPNNVDYYITMVYSFGGTAARRSIDNSAKSAKKNIFAREFHRRDFVAPAPSKMIADRLSQSQK